MKKQYPVIIAVVAAVAGLAYFILAGNGETLPSDIAKGNGRIEAVQVDISTKIAGRVSEILVREGDLVEPGQHLATIDTAELEAEALRAEADIANAQSQVAAATAAIAQAQAQLVLAEQELQRARKLVDQGHTSRETYDTRLSSRDVAKANLEVARATLVSRERSVDAAKALAAQIKTQIDDARLVSPVRGRVLYRLAEPGEVLGSGGRVLTILDLSDVYMEIFLPSAQAHRVEIGAEAKIKLDILDFAIPASVSFVSPESQFTPKEVETPSERDKLMFRVKVTVPHADIRRHINKVKTGVRGVAYVRLTPDPGGVPSPWPDTLPPPPAGEMDQDTVGAGN